MKAKLGFIGAGVMAGAILDGVLNAEDKTGVNASDILIFDPIREKCDRFAARGIGIADSESAVFSGADIVFLAVKPQSFRPILLQNRASVSCKTVVSIMAGVTLKTLASYLPGDVGIVRVMPNMCLRVGKGMCAVTCSDNVSETEKKKVFAVFSASGDVMEFEEEKFDAVTAVSGSGPAYIFYVANSMVKAGVALGLTEAESRRLALATLEGAAVMAKDSDESLSVLVDRVCSKGGTTIEAVKCFDNGNLDGIIADGMVACKHRSEEMSAEMV